MIRLLFNSYGLLIMFFMWGSLCSQTPSDWVDPFMGTEDARPMLFPGVALPFGMVKFSPNNQPTVWRGGYEHTIKSIHGFGLIHEYHAHGFNVMPHVGSLQIRPGRPETPDQGYRSRTSYETMNASPGYYAVKLDDYGVDVELTSTLRTGFMRLTFPQSDQARILFDMENPYEATANQVKGGRITKVSATEIEGHVKYYNRVHNGSTLGLVSDYTVYFVAKLDKPFKSMGGWSSSIDSRLVGNSNPTGLGNANIEYNIDELNNTQDGDFGIWLDFTTSSNETIQLKTSISLVSIANARNNLDMETNVFGWNFDNMRGEAKQQWNDLLGKIEVEGGDNDTKTKFYTNMYRSYAPRSIWSDANGQYRDMNKEIVQLENPNDPIYGSDAFWGCQWNLFQLWSLVTPEYANKWVKSLLYYYERGGWLPKGPVLTQYSSIMLASHHIALIVNAYQSGIRNFDVNQAYEAIKHDMTTQGTIHSSGSLVGLRYLTDYQNLGYVPSEAGPASATMEYAYNDYIAAQFAKALQKTADYNFFIERSKNWTNIYNDQEKYVWKKNRAGQWASNFEPFTSNGFIEGNPWQYTYFVPHEIESVVSLLGKSLFESRLESGFETSQNSRFNATGDQYALYPVNHGNQPNMQAAYLFNHSGSPWLTQKWVRKIMDIYYGTGVDAYPGDEDQGQMGGWFVMSALGLFQMNGGVDARPIYEIGSPLFDKATIKLDPNYTGQGEFTIETINNSATNVYIQSATLNGRALNSRYFYREEIKPGGSLVLTMGSNPNTSWGLDSILEPVAIEDKKAGMGFVNYIKLGNEKVALPGKNPISIYVYNLSGKRIESFHADMNSHHQLDQYGNGIFLVRIKQGTFKKSLVVPGIPNHN